MDLQSLSHTRWECKYHIVWIPNCVDSEMSEEGTVYGVEKVSG